MKTAIESSSTRATSISPTVCVLCQTVITVFSRSSVNNKVPNFNYGELVRRLAEYYQANKDKPIEGFKKLRKVRNCDIFHLPEDLNGSITLETREGKADIVRLSFGIEDEYLDELIAEPPNFMELIHQYCVAPLRRIYAEVYRIKRK